METSTIPEPTATDRLGAVIQRAVGAPNPTPEPNVMPVISVPPAAPAAGQPVSIAPDAPIEPSPTVEIAPDAPIESIPKSLSEVQPGQKFNPIKDFDTKGLADFSTKNPKFNILDEFQSLPRSEQDNFDIRQKVATALRTSRQDTGVLDGLSVGGIAHTVGTMGKGFWDWLHNFVPMVSNTILARTPLAGKDAEGIKDVAGQQAAQSAAGLQTMGFGLAKQVLDLSKWAARHSIGTAHDVAPDSKPLWMKPYAEYTPQDDLELLNNEVAARTVMGKIASGEKLPMDAAHVLKEKGVPVNPELVSSLAAGDPVAFALQAKLFGAAGKGVSAVTPEIVKDAFSKALQTASKVAPVAAGKALSKIGAASEAVGKIAEPIAKSAPVKFALAKFLGGPGAILQEGIEHAAKRLPGIGKAASGVGEEMASGQIASPYAQALSDMASSAPNFAASVLSGAAFDAAMLGTTEGTPAEKEGVAGIGTLFGAVGGLHGAGQRLVGGQLIGRRFGSFTPAMTQKFLDVVAPGTEFKDFSVKDSNGNHNDAASQDAAKRWMISNGLAPDLAETNSKQAGATLSLGGKTYAFSTVDRLTHEAVHAIQSTLPPEQQQRIRSYVRDRYSDAEWNQYKDYYANQLSRSATGKPLADGVSPNDYIKATTGTADVDSYINDEIQAEHLNTFLQHAGPELTPGKSLPELLARAAGKVIQGFGGNPLEGQMSTSPSVPLPLRQDIVSKLAGEIRPRITEEAKAAAAGLEETRKIASKHEGQIEKVKDWVNNQTTTPVVTPSGVTVKPTLAPDQAQAIKSLADATASGEEHDVEYWGAQGGPGTEIASMRPERRAEIEAQRSAKNEKRRPFIMRFLPRSVRATKKGAQFVGISSDVLQANVDKSAAWMTEVEQKSPGATKSLPYDLTTQTGRAEYEKDLRTYNENQSNGYTGSGLPLNVPTDVVTRTGGKIYAPEVKGKPIPLEQAKADFINYTYNTQIPEGNSKVAPLHIAGQDISQATLPGRVVSPVSPRGEYTPEQLKAMKLDETSPRGVREVNPVRKQIEQIAQATVPKPSLIEAEVRLNHDRIISAKPVTSEAKTPVKGSNLLTREAGFEPNAKTEDEDLSKRLENLNDTEDQEKAKQAAQFEPATDAGKEAEDRGFSFVHETDPETGTIRLALLNDLGKQVSLLDAAPDHAQPNKMFHVDNVITDEAYRRQGLATVLYRELGALLQKKGVKVLGGLTVNDNPRGAREKVFGPPIREQKLESAQGPGYDFRKTFSAIKSDAQFEPASTAGASGEDPKLLARAQKAWTDKGVKSPFFKKWFGKSKVVDSDGQPLEVFHGTTHDFDEFKHVRPNLENSFGAGHYFSTSEADVSDNYAGIGPDLKSRIDRRTEQLLDLENVEYGSGDYDLALKKAEAQARQELAGDNPHAIAAYLKMENPAVLDPKGGTRLEYSYDENTGDETGPAIDLYQALLAEAPELDADGKEIWDHVSMDGDLDGMTLYNVESKILESAMDASHPETGEYAANELVRRVFQHMGYDGIIVTDPATRYPGMGLSSDTKHYIVFNPEQIKGAENRGTFSPSDKRYNFEPSKEDKDSLTLPVDNEPHSVTMATVPSIIENAVDDASKEKRPTQFEPSDKEELSNAVGDKTIRLVHLSSNPSLKYVDPAYLGKGKANPNDTRGAFKSYWFVRGSKLMGDESILGLGGHHSYQSEISGEKIYDLRHNKPDPEGYFSRINREEADTELKRKGYDGLMVDTSDGRKVVMLYKKQPVKYVAPFKGSQAEPGVLDHPDFDKEVEKVRTGAAGGVTLKIDGSPYVWNPKDKRDVVTLKSFNVPQAQATPDQIRSLLSSQTDLLENPHIVAGLFAFSKDGKPTISVDLNALVPQKFRKNTVNFARDNDQVAMWDPFGGPKGEGEEIRTGGEGNTRLNDLGEISDALAPLLKGEPVNVDEIKRQNADVGPKQEQGFFEGIGGKEPLSSAQVGKMTKAEIAAHHPESVVPRARDEKINYDITESPLYKQSGDEDGAVKAFSRRLVSFAKEHLDRPEFKNGLKWYSEFVPMLKKVYGKSAETMAQLLAATSPRNSPTPNFALANDALEGFKSGRFNKKIQKYLDGVTKIESGQWEKWYNAQKKAGKLINPRDNPTPEAFMAEWITAHDLQPRQSNGKLFGMHSTAVLQVLAGNWLTENTGPKTHQFVKNLLGLHHGATIDVWAARTMRRLGYDGFKPRWRILPGNETGVQDTDFHFSQKAFAHAAKELGLTPDALQGGLWFAEKKLWADKGWGRLDLGDYRNEIKKVELLNAGIEQRLARHKAESKAKETQPLDLLSALPSR